MSFIGLLRCKRSSMESLSGDKQRQEKESSPASLTSVTSSPQASPVGSSSISSNHHHHTAVPSSTTNTLLISERSASNNNTINCKTNGQTRIWSIVGDIEVSILLFFDTTIISFSNAIYAPLLPVGSKRSLETRSWSRSQQDHHPRWSLQSQTWVLFLLPFMTFLTVVVLNILCKSCCFSSVSVMLFLFDSRVS